MLSSAQPHRPPRLDILGVPVDAVDLADAVALAEAAIAARQRLTILAVNPEKTMAARSDAELRALLTRAELLIPDGIGTVLAARLLARARLGRVAGADLMPALCAAAARHGRRVFLFGAKPEVNAAAAETVSRRFPGLIIAGRQDGFVAEAAMDTLIDSINAARPDMLFVALGSPRQERWLARYGDRLEVPVRQGVGGTFDVLAGHVARAPVWAQRTNTEWLYRLVTDPRRAQRQAALPRFAWAVLRTWATGATHAGR